MEKIILFLRQFGILIIIGGLGIVILAYGLWEETWPKETVVEIIRGSEVKGINTTGNSQIVVDVAGSVENPGVYTLPSSSRIGDALVMAGGLSASADRDWVAKSINLAEVVKDGGKLYIPTKSDKSVRVSTNKVVGSVVADNKININSASPEEIDGLVGIGEVRAKTIIENRPYSSIEELVSKAKIPQSIYEKIKDSISIY